MTLKDKIFQKFKVYGVPVTSADCSYVFHMLRRHRPVFTLAWVERFLEQRNIKRGKESNRAADRLLQRWRILGLIKFNKGYWSWTSEGKKCVV